MKNQTRKFEFTGAAGQKLDGRLELPLTGQVRAVALFAHIASPVQRRAMARREFRLRSRRRASLHCALILPVLAAAAVNLPIAVLRPMSMIWSPRPMLCAIPMLARRS